MFYFTLIPYTVMSTIWWMMIVYNDEYKMMINNIWLIIDMGVNIDECNGRMIDEIILSKIY